MLFSTSWSIEMLKAWKGNCPFKPAEKLLSPILVTEHKTDTIVLDGLQKTSLELKKKNTH